MRLKHHRGRWVSVFMDKCEALDIGESKISVFPNIERSVVLLDMLSRSMGNVLSMNANVNGYLSLDKWRIEVPVGRWRKPKGDNDGG